MEELLCVELTHVCHLQLFRFDYEHSLYFAQDIILQHYGSTENQCSVLHIPILVK